MQLTRFDRWLREKFVYETHIFTMREIDPPPRGVAGYRLPEKPGQRYRYEYVTRTNKAADRIIHDLKATGMAYTTRVVDRKVWYVRFLAPKAKSPTWWLVSTATLISFFVSLAYGAHLLWANPVIRAHLLDALETLKN